MLTLHLCVLILWRRRFILSKVPPTTSLLDDVMFTVSSVTGASSTTTQWDRKTIIVHGLRPGISRDAIRIFFEDQSRSGGGVTNEVKFDRNKKVASVTFVHRGGQLCVQLCLHFSP